MSIKTNLVVVSTHLKNISQIWIIFPGTSGVENKKYLSCHHLENQPLLFKSFPTLQNHHLLWPQHDLHFARQNVGNQIIPSEGQPSLVAILMGFFGKFPLSFPPCDFLGWVSHHLEFGCCHQDRPFWFNRLTQETVMWRCIWQHKGGT